MDLIDLHTHSSCSDGTQSPGELVALANRSRLRAIALTDHDTTAGIEEAEEAGRQWGVEVVPGVEISARHDNCSFHLLAYGIRPDQELQDLLEKVQEARRRRNARIIDNLNRLRIRISLSDLESFSGPGQIGRPHIARMLVERGVVKSVEQAFSRYLRKGAAAYEESLKLPAGEVIRTIGHAGGLAVLAHPANILSSPTMIPGLLRALKPLGLAGMEVYYPTHSSRTTRQLREMAEAFGLLLTGGSDFHGENRPDAALGRVSYSSGVPYELLLAMKRHPGWSEE